MIHGPRTSISPTASPSPGRRSPSGPTIRASTPAGDPALRVAGRPRPPARSTPAGARATGPERRRLGHAPGVDDLDAVPLVERVHQRRRAGRAADDDLPQRGDVGRVGVEVGAAGRSRSSARRRRASASPRRSSAASGAACRKRSGMTSEAPVMQRRVRQAPGHRVEHRHDREHVASPWARGRTLSADAHLHRVQVDRAVAVDDALRVAGRAGGVAHRGGVVLVHARASRTGRTCRRAASSQRWTVHAGRGRASGAASPSPTTTMWRTVRQVRQHARRAAGSASSRR